MKLLLEMVHNANYRAQLAKDSITEKALNVLDDPKQEERLREHKCVCCFYLRKGMITGQGFTEWECLGCELKTQHHNTGVPKLCYGCAKKYGLCTQCSADIDLRTRKKLLRGRR